MTSESRVSLRSAAKLLGLAAADLRAAANSLDRGNRRRSVGKFRHMADECEKESRRLWMFAGNGQIGED